MTEIVAMELTGASSLGWVTVRVRDGARHPGRRSTGEIEERRDVVTGRLDIEPFCDPAAEPGCAGTTAHSFFDVYFEIETPAGLLHSHRPKHVESEIRFKPPRQPYEVIERIPLFAEDETPSPIAVTGVLHLPRPPEEEVEVLRQVLSLRSPEPGARLAAIETLSALGERAAAAVPALRLLLEDADRTVAAAAREALARLGTTAAPSTGGSVR